MRTRAGRAVLPSPCIIVDPLAIAAPRPGLAPYKTCERREGRAVSPLVVGIRDTTIVRQAQLGGSLLRDAGFRLDGETWISEIMSEAASSLVMPEAVATVSSNRSRSSDPKRSRLRYKLLPDRLGDRRTGERGV